MAEGSSEVRAVAAGMAKRALRATWHWLVAAAVVLAVLGAVFRNSIQWGDAATWVLAATSTVALWAAGFAGAVAYRLLEVELGRDRVAAEERRAVADERRRAQAARVAAWFGSWGDDDGYPAGMSGPPGRLRWGAVIRNASDLPVYDVRFSYHVAVDPGRRGRTWRAGERFQSRDIIPVIPPGVERSAIPNYVREEQADGRWLVAVSFTDADGRRWRRDVHGMLTGPESGDDAGAEAWHAGQPG
jgi:hypothetical protein